MGIALPVLPKTERVIFDVMVVHHNVYELGQYGVCLHAFAVFVPVYGNIYGTLCAVCASIYEKRGMFGFFITFAILGRPLRGL